uniref:4-diphosphocytidyl-2-C-methyl-D-erythritol kinase n=1 Tax=Candidatus Kentrum sp. DK TaxID=2126562 RepID=A0A450T221_9GAMM|nr:MAG: 4-diphosphocytidyl-2-C-methyl-D-erythritol kinase [Candidatus Kentron sp. DK]VFJ60315.1 MAG: 4-diphosphocytidyl-2-C-methyl-D-erythritol kinase [Candidatus Kentron sp. DK]
MPSENVPETLPAPAKINLFLHITGRRADGYHELETIFQFLDLADEITLKIRGDGNIRRMVDPAGDSVEVPEERDLTVRAARALKAATGSPLGADITLKKRIPTGGGLGGGSSDAAAVLVGLNRVWKLGLGMGKLAEIGLTLGADVPVFVRGQAAFATGVGEKLLPVELPEPWYLVISPGCAVPTAEIFNAPDLTRDTPPIKIHTLLPEGTESAPRSPAPYRKNKDSEKTVQRVSAAAFELVSSLFWQTGNDCEAVVRKNYPPVNAALRWLSRFGNARMTGTGACVFAPFRERREAEQMLSLLPGAAGEREEREGWTGFVARGLNRSPLIEVDFQGGVYL